MLTKLNEKKNAFLAKLFSIFSIEQLQKLERLGMMWFSTMYMCSTVMAATASAGTIVGTLLGYIGRIFMYIGIILLVWSIGQLVLAFKNEDADSKSRAVMVMVVSIILISMDTILNTLVGALGVDNLSYKAATDL